MTRNAAKNMNRKSSALVYSGAEGEEKFEMVETAVSKPAGVDAKLDADSLAKKIYKWIDELPERRKEAFVLSRHHDLSHKEISDIMGLSERTVNTHIFLALKHLRAQLDALQKAE
jgi:RNA polymerase sigma-70 factor (ECF subfamily)